MPMYEYESVEDGEVITLLRRMQDADAPVVDPAGDGRTFRRRHSVFGVGVAGVGRVESPPVSSGCACGRPDGGCGMTG